MTAKACNLVAECVRDLGGDMVAGFAGHLLSTPCACQCQPAQPAPVRHSRLATAHKCGCFEFATLRCTPLRDMEPLGGCSLCAPHDICHRSRLGRLPPTTHTPRRVDNRQSLHHVAECVRDICGNMVAGLAGYLLSTPCACQCQPAKPAPVWHSRLASAHKCGCFEFATLRCTPLRDMVPLGGCSLCAPHDICHQSRLGRLPPTTHTPRRVDNRQSLQPCRRVCARHLRRYGCRPCRLSTFNALCVSVSACPACSGKA